MSDEVEKMDVTVPETGQQEQTSASGIKEMTAEEKAEQLKRVEERIKQRKKEIQEEEKQREIEREKARRRDGQDLVKIKSEMEWREAQKLAEERKKQKREDRLARQRVKEQIAQDRANMKEQNEKKKALAATASGPRYDPQSTGHHVPTKINEEKLERERIKKQIEEDRANMKLQTEKDRKEHAGLYHQSAHSAAEHHGTPVDPKVEERLERQRIKEQIAIDRANMKRQAELDKQKHATADPSKSEPQTLSPTSHKKDYHEAKLQIRLPSNKRLVQIFNAEEPLSAVRLYIELNSGGELGPFIDLSTTFPRKVFTEDQMQMTLRELDLIPTAVIQATRGRMPETL